MTKEGKDEGKKKERDAQSEKDGEGRLQSKEGRAKRKEISAEEKRI